MFGFLPTKEFPIGGQIRSLCKSDRGLAAVGWKRPIRFQNSGLGFLIGSVGQAWEENFPQGLLGVSWATNFPQGSFFFGLQAARS